jgi:hypothetical protein
VEPSHFLAVCSSLLLLIVRLSPTLLIACRLSHSGLPPNSGPRHRMGHVSHPGARDALASRVVTEIIGPQPSGPATRRPCISPSRTVYGRPTEYVVPTRSSKVFAVLPSQIGRSDSHELLPVLPIIGEPNGGPFYFNFSRGTFVALLGASLLLAFAQGWAAWLLWGGKRSGALLQFGLLPVEAAFWYGFALPIPPLLAIVRLVLTELAWRGLR